MRKRTNSRCVFSQLFSYFVSTPSYWFLYEANLGLVKTSIFLNKVWYQL